MNVIQKIREILDESYPEIIYNIENGVELSIDKTAQNGFDVRVIDASSESIIYFNQWHWHFDNNSNDVDQLYLIFGYALSKHGRLKAFIKGGKEYKWNFETLNSLDGEWTVFGTTGTVNLKFWLEPTVKIYQNEMIEISQTHQAP
ncbi:MAG: hypothetical protein MK105_15745 [Crocinitomicaceae bacterium]|nr:hypothetical protein [Crocinitomicaceae bacterium]